MNTQELVEELNKYQESNTDQDHVKLGKRFVRFMLPLLAEGVNFEDAGNAIWMLADNQNSSGFIYAIAIDWVVLNWDRGQEVNAWWSKRT